VRSVLERAGAFIEDLHLARVLSADIEVVDLPHEEQPWTPEESEDEDES
jgi:hypothetical protein